MWSGVTTLFVKYLLYFSPFLHCTQPGYAGYVPAGERAPSNQALHCGILPVGYHIHADRRQVWRGKNGYRV